MPDWKELHQQILGALDIRAEYEQLGVEPTQSTPRGTGWLPCRAFDREDRNPSAEIAVSGNAIGRYRDFKTAENYSLWDFAADIAGAFPTWLEARRYYAHKVGVDIGGVPETKRPKDSFRFGKKGLQPTALWGYCRNKGGISPDAVARCGAVEARFPKRSSSGSYVYAFPAFDASLFDGDPVGWHCVGHFGRDIEIVSYSGDGEKKKREVKHVKTLQKGPPGLLNTWAIENIAQAEVVWWVEGITDLLAMQTQLRDRTDHVVVTMGGVSYMPDDALVERLRGKVIYVCFDQDPPDSDNPAGAGAGGAARLITKIAPVALQVRNVKLPHADATRKFDIRDYFATGAEYEDLLAIAKLTKPIDPATVSREYLKTVKDGVITNYVAIAHEEGTEMQPIAVADIVESLKTITGGWPKATDGQLFVHADKNEDVRFITSANSFFGNLHMMGRMDWCMNQTNCISKSEFFEVFRTQADQVDSLQNQPHFPPIPEAYYVHPTPPAGDGKTLTKFVDAFSNVSQVEDWDLILSCILSLFWGGAPGMRPCFLFTSKAGRGVGKTTTAQKIAKLVGDAFHFSKQESLETMNKRLLSNQSSGKRVCLIDNVKTARFSWAEFEAIVTADKISGHKMYVGDASRPNYFTWFLTLNGPSLSTDVAQRVIPVELKRPPKDNPNWSDDLDEFIIHNHQKIIADIRAMFERPPKPFEVKLRWGPWARDVLGRLHDPEAAQQVILDRQNEYDVESEENEDLEDAVYDLLLLLDYKPDRTNVFIPSAVMAKIMGSLRGTNRGTPGGAVRLIKQAVGEGSITRLRTGQRDNKGKSRGILWLAAEQTPDTKTAYDLKFRANNYDGNEWKKLL